jgi:hypothetical protein
MSNRHVARAAIRGLSVGGARQPHWERPILVAFAAWQALFARVRMANGGGGGGGMSSNMRTRGLSDTVNDGDNDGSALVVRNPDAAATKIQGVFQVGGAMPH